MVIELLKISLEELQTKQSHLLNLSIVNLDEYLDSGLLKEILARFFPAGTDMGLFLLALFGWRYHQTSLILDDVESTADVIECSQCFRRIGLWKSPLDKKLLSAGEEDPQPTEEASSSSTTASSPVSVFDPATLSAMPSEQVASKHPASGYPLRSEMYQLDPVAAHRSYCSVVKEIRGLHEPTWSYLLKPLVKALQPSQVSSLEKVKRIKTLAS